MVLEKNTTVFAENENAGKEIAKTEVLDLQNISKTYGTIEAVKDVSLQVNKGEVIAILGPSGCGKSTLLRCINGLEKIQSGDIYLSGERIAQTEKDWRALRPKVGMVFQHYELFPHMTVMENLMLAPQKVQGRAKEEIHTQASALLKRVELLDRQDAYPHQLSGGQKQRIAIVRSLCMNPEVILFDEVTAALDPEMVFEVLQVIKDLALQGMTMLIVTHELGFAKAVAHKIVFMDSGSIVEISTPKEFFERPKTERAQKFLEKFLY